MGHVPLGCVSFVILPYSTCSTHCSTLKNKSKPRNRNHSANLEHNGSCPHIMGLFCDFYPTLPFQLQLFPLVPSLGKGNLFHFSFSRYTFFISAQEWTHRIVISHERTSVNFLVLPGSLLSITEITEYTYFSLIETLAEFKYKSD